MALYNSITYQVEAVYVTSDMLTGFTGWPDWLNGILFLGKTWGVEGSETAIITIGDQQLSPQATNYVVKNGAAITIMDKTSFEAQFTPSEGGGGLP